MADKKSDDATAPAATESAAALTDSVSFELTTEPAPAEDVREVKPTEEGWTAQSSHGVLLNHFVPTQNYAALDSPAEQVNDDGDDW